MDSSKILLVIMAAVLVLLVWNMGYSGYSYPIPSPMPRRNRVSKCDMVKRKIQSMKQNLTRMEAQAKECAENSETEDEYVGKTLVEVRELLNAKYPEKELVERENGKLYAMVVQPNAIYVYYDQLEIPANVRAEQGTFTEVTRVQLPRTTGGGRPYNPIGRPTVRPFKWQKRPSVQPYMLRPGSFGSISNMPYMIKPSYGGRRGRSMMM